MDIAGFDWDDGNWPKCGQHGVSKEEIEALFANEPGVFPDPPHSQAEDRLLAIGQATEGRWIFVAFTLRDGADGKLIRPISARYMHRREVNHYGL